MTSLLDAPTGFMGAQRPRLSWVPPHVSSSGPEVIELSASAGLYLDDWQQFILAESLGEVATWKCSRCVFTGSAGQPLRCPDHPRTPPLHPWSAFEVGVVVPRQNGKGGIIEARELGGLFLFGERLIIHSAHQFDTSLEAFGRLLALIEDTPELRKRIKRVSNAHGQEGITLRSGQRIRFRTRTKGGGRGFTGDCLILDEAMDVPESTHAALFPTLSARANPQVWYTGSAVDEEVDDNGVVFARVRERGLRGGDPALAYFEFSAALEIDKLTKADTDKREHWVAANPALGIRISAEHIGRERLSMSTRKFAVERFCVGAWPRTDDLADRVITRDAWGRCADVESESRNPVSFAFDVSPDRSRACISMAGDRADGLSHVEVIQHDRGTGWVPRRLLELKTAHKPAAIVCDPRGPAGSLLSDLEALGIEVTETSATEHAQACGLFYDAVMDQTPKLRHLDTPELNAAVDGAATRNLGEAWAWDRRNSDVDITPLVSVTLAHWGNAQRPKKPKARVINLNRV